MADMGLKDFILGRDLLGEHDMKPWWETFHSYLLGSSLTIAILLTWMVAPSDVVDCLPFDFVVTEEKFSEPQAALTNGFCLSHTPWYGSYSGLICTGAATVVLVLSNLWLSHPDVINAFRMFSKAERTILELQSSTEKLKLVAISPVFDTEGEAYQLRKMCVHLWTYSRKIERYYHVRNAVVVLCTLASACMCSYMAHFASTLSSEPFFNCSLPEKIENVHALEGHRDFICSYNIAQKIPPFLVLFIITLVSQVVMLGCGVQRLLSSVAADRKDTAFTHDFATARSYTRFMRVFWINSRPIDSEGFAELIEFIFSKHALDAMSTFIEAAVTNVATKIVPPEQSSHRGKKNETVPNPDLDFIRLFGKMHSEGGNIILTTLYKIFENRKGKNNVDDLCDALCCFEFKEWDENAMNFLDAAVQKRNWYLVVKILNAAQREVDYKKFNLNELEFEKSTRNSILYYALQKDRVFETFRLNAARYILKCSKQDSVATYVHFDGKSVLASKFVQQQRSENPAFSDSLSQDLLNLISECELSWKKTAKPTRTQLEFQRLFDIYRKVAEADTEDPTDGKRVTGAGPKPDNYVALEEIAHGVAHMKFHCWDEEMQKFAMLAASKRHWKIFIKILEAKIIPFSENSLTGPQKQDCGVENFPLDQPMEHCDWYGRSVLFYIFDDDAKACKPPFTSFRHILSCNWGKRMKVRELRRTKTLQQYIRDCKYLDVEWEEELKRWVEESEKGAPAAKDVPDTRISWPARCVYE